MSWFRVDDQLPDHRKARAVRKTHPTKRRDVAPFGLWAFAGAWSSDGFVPLEVLEDWDDDAFELAERLVAAGLWHPTERDGEPGYVFHDWHDQNPARDDNDPSKSGTFGNHVRWHVQRKKVDPDCDHCPKEAVVDEPSDRPDIAPMIAPIGGDIAPDAKTHRGESLPSRPVPTPTRPGPEPTTSSDKSDDLDRFDEFWDIYGKKVKRADAEKKWAKAIRKVDADRIISAAAAYVAYERANNEGGRFIADPSTWLHGERWRDERTDLPLPQTRVQEHLTLVQQLAAEEAEQPTLPQIGYRR